MGRNKGGNNRLWTAEERLKDERAYILDTFNNEIISSHLSDTPGDRRPCFKVSAQ